MPRRLERGYNSPNTQKRRYNGMWELSSYKFVKCYMASIYMYQRTATTTKQIRGRREEEISEVQAGFWKGRGTMEQIFVIRQLSEKYTEMNRTLYNNFIDFKQAFDRVGQEGL